MTIKVQRATRVPSCLFGSLINAIVALESRQPHEANSRPILTHQLKLSSHANSIFHSHQLKVHNKSDVMVEYLYSPLKRTPSSEPSSLFLILPAEIRNEIYRFIILCHTISITERGIIHSDGILHTCRQIYREIHDWIYKWSEKSSDTPQSLLRLIETFHPLAPLILRYPSTFSEYWNDSAFQAQYSILCVQNGHMNMVTALLDTGADINTVLIIACEHNRLDLIESLLKRFATYYHSSEQLLTLLIN
jgi:hypothetical protein